MSDTCGALPPFADFEQLPCVKPAGHRLRAGHCNANRAVWTASIEDLMDEYIATTHGPLPIRVDPRPRPDCRVCGETFPCTAEIARQAELNEILGDQ